MRQTGIMPKEHIRVDQQTRHFFNGFPTEHTMGCITDDFQQAPYSITITRPLTDHNPD